MSVRLVKATDLAVGDVLALPMGRTATISEVASVGPRNRFVNFRTEHGRSRIEVTAEVMIVATETGADR